MDVIICPHCKETLNKSEPKSYACSNRHNFDLSKEGYLNLLAVNQKKSKSPGDNELMISARRNFLEQGFYDPMIYDLKQVINTELTFENEAFTALDAGCGEGYYSEKALKNKNTKRTVLGTDISKYAVKNAAKKYKDNFYFVGSVYHLPIATKSIDLILSIFSPIHGEEFQRIVKNKGYLLVVSPGPNHLKELAELIYNSFRPHQNNIAEGIKTNFELQSESQSTFTIQLSSSETLLMLLKMTPYYWNTSKEAMERLTNCNEISITCDFNLSIFKAIS